MSKVLVIDDEPQIRRALRTSLEAHGYEVVTVGTGQEGVVGAAGGETILISALVETPAAFTAVSV